MRKSELLNGRKYHYMLMLQDPVTNVICPSYFPQLPILTLSYLCHMQVFPSSFSLMDINQQSDLKAVGVLNLI